jgi:hypothetical protein
MANLPRTDGAPSSRTFRSEAARAAEQPKRPVRGRLPQWCADFKGEFKLENGRDWPNLQLEKNPRWQH